jgi:hypothetical protein
VWFGGNVLNGLVEVIDAHVAAEAQRREPMPAALGCVPWLTHQGIAERLARLAACCVVVDKGRKRPPPPVLVAADNGVPNLLPGLRNRAPGGETLILGPSSPMPEYTVGPVRVVGMTGAEQKPLLHAKLLVLGRLKWIELGDGPTEEVLTFEPCSVWWGSANWTKTAHAHLELGAWSTDPALVREATDFLDDLIAFSEPLDSAAHGPEADLVLVDYDEAAMWEAWRDIELEQWDDDEP